MYGYPFKSKLHSRYVYDWYNGKTAMGAVRYFRGYNRSSLCCPNILKYQFKTKPPFNISSKCCDKLKKEPFNTWRKLNNKPYLITGIRRAEGGQRITAKCIQITNNKLNHFNPLAIIDDQWIEWFIRKYNIELCALYNKPYNFKRTGCKGCPFNRYLDNELKILKQYFPSEYTQCELIWKPVYDEYRRINYRLKK